MAHTLKTSYETAMDHKPDPRGFELSASTSPMHPRQVEEFGNLLNQGLTNVEIGTINVNTLDDIPVQHLDAIKQLSKLTGANVSLHGPVNGVDLAGLPGEGQGQRWSEDLRKKTQEHVISILDKAHRLSDNGNVPVVFHAGNWDAQKFDKELGIDPKTGLPKVRSMMIVNQDTGELQQVEYDRTRYIDIESNEEEIKREIKRKEERLKAEGHKPEEIKNILKKERDLILQEGIEYTPQRKLQNINETQWNDDRLKMFTVLKDIKEIQERMHAKIEENESLEKMGIQNHPDYLPLFKRNEDDIQYYRDHIHELSTKLSSTYNNLYEKFEKFGSAEDKTKFMQTVGARWQEKFGSAEDLKKAPDPKSLRDYVQRRNEKMYQSLEELQKKQRDLEQKYGKDKIPLEKQMELNKEERKFLQLHANQLQDITTIISEMEAPKIWKPLNDFALQQVSKTASNSLFEAWKKYGDKAPMLVMENYFPDKVLSTAQDLKKTVHESRKQLAEKLVKEGKLKEDEAKKTAEKLIGATWDLGHVSVMRSAGFTEKEIQEFAIKQTKEAAEVIKHVHITDNFGFFDSHLAPGMGIVPIDKMLMELEKEWAKQKLDRKPIAVAEAGAFVGNFKVSPHLEVLSYFNKTLFEGGAGPYWTSAAEGGIGHSYASYHDRFVEFPQQHFNLYGSSFTTLPKTFGGQVGGDSSRFSGTPNQ